MATQRKRTRVYVNMTAVLVDCPMLEPKLLRKVVWEVVKSRQREELALAMILGTLNEHMALPGYELRQAGKTYREGR